MYESHGWYGPPSASPIWQLLGLAAPATDATPRSSAVERNGLSEGFRGVVLAMLPFPDDFFYSSLIYSNSKEKKETWYIGTNWTHVPNVKTSKDIGFWYFECNSLQKYVANFYIHPMGFFPLHLMRRLHLNWYRSFHRKRAARWEISWRSWSFKDQPTRFDGDFKGRSQWCFWWHFSVGCCFFNRFSFWGGPDPEKKQQNKALRPL